MSANRVQLTGFIEDLVVRQNLQRIVESINALQGTVALIGGGESGGQPIANTASFALQPSKLYGYNASGALALATNVTPIRAAFAVSKITQPGGNFRPLQSGVVLPLFYDPSATLGPSVPAYLGTGGAITDAAHAESFRQYIGLIIGEAANNAYPVLLAISQSAQRLS